MSDNKIHNINRILLALGIITGNILWIKCIFDLYEYGKKIFPQFFIPLFALGLLVNISIIVYIAREIIFEKNELKLFSGKIVLFIWLSIPLSIICTSFVCYRQHWWITRFPVSTIIRQCALVLPVFLYFFYIKFSKKYATFLLLLLSFLLLIPNDKCYNPFNIWWIDKIGYSPLTYLPTFYAIQLSVCGFYNQKKGLVLISVYIICLAALFISIGHRLHFLW